MSSLLLRAIAAMQLVFEEHFAMRFVCVLEWPVSGTRFGFSG